MGVDVDEARRHQQAACIDLALAHAELRANGGNPAVLHRNIGGFAGLAGAIDHGAVSDDEVKHTPRIGLRQAGGLCSGPSNPFVSGTPPLQKPLLFTPFTMRGVTAPNRAVVSPMVQYRATDGQVNDYHIVHLGKFALGKFGIVFTENCAIEPGDTVAVVGTGSSASQIVPAIQPIVRELYKAKDYGQFRLPKLNELPVAVLYNADTTGGNSGSPLLNARGELVGVNFDRAWGATINDYAWNEAYSRSIAVDIRYVLWVTQKVGKADFLLKEMGVR